jgi:hypothetical protein
MKIASMSFASITLRQLDQVPGLDPDQCIAALATAFGDSMTVDPRDQLLVSIQRARDLFKGEPPTHPVLRALERNMRTQGPARAFTMKLGGKEVRGVAKRPLFQLLWKGTMDEGVLQHVIAIVLSAAPPRDELKIEIDQDRDQNN